MKFSSFQFALLFVPLIFSFSLTAQITGLWEITSVTVGDESMTPIAKWTHIHKNGTYESGNGWLQNSKGVYTYNAQANTFLADDSLGFDDPYGPFTVGLNENKMTWTRTEDGLEVTVSLKRIYEKPMAPADKIFGAWDLVKAELGDRDVTTDMDPNNAVITLMRWDRNFVSVEPDGKRTTGFWVINAHRPELTLIHHDKKKDDGRWNLTFEGDRMVWEESEMKEAPLRFTFQRMGQFPKDSSD